MKNRSTLYVCFLAAALACTSQAATVTVTINGTLTGYDYNGVFFPGQTYPYAFPANTTYQLVFTFNDALGTVTPYHCSGTPCASYVYGTGANSPGTATLTINGNSFTFGAVPRSGITSSAFGSIPTYGYDEVKYVVGDAGSSVSINIYAVGSGNVFGNTYDRRSPIATTTSESHTTYYTTTINESGGAHATAYLSISDFSVSGIPSGCEPPIAEASNTWCGWDGTTGCYTGSGQQVRVGDFNSTVASLAGFSSDYSGATVQEKDAGGGSDGCYVASVDAGLVIPANNIDNLPGSHSETLNAAGAWGDRVGYDTATIDYYRSKGRAPCGFTVYQQMQYQCPNGAWVNYGGVNTLKGYITSNTTMTNVQATREALVETTTAH